MADILMPQMGESIAEGTVTKWLKAWGTRCSATSRCSRSRRTGRRGDPLPRRGSPAEIRIGAGKHRPHQLRAGVIAARHRRRAADVGGDGTTRSALRRRASGRGRPRSGSVVPSPKP